MNTELHTLFEWFMQMNIYKSWMEGTYDIPNKNPQKSVSVCNSFMHKFIS